MRLPDPCIECGKRHMSTSICTPKLLRQSATKKADQWESARIKTWEPKK